MARNCAVIVGINDYDEISPLKYAKSDAERMRDFFMQDLGVSQDDLYFFTDDSPRNAQGRKTQPTYGTLKSFLGDRFENSFLSAGDTLWFYFSGHGMPCEGRDYLLPSDGNPRSIPDLAIPIGYVTERLRRSGADNVVMLIDACRSDGAKNAGMGIGEEKQQGVITFFSCSPSQVSYEIDEIGQGAFTNVLLEALRIQGEGNCATVERFANYLKDRVPQVTQKYKQYRQVPYVKIEPETKLHYLLLPKFANLTDIALLREDALHAEVEEDFALAFQLWMRVNVASGGTDMRAIDALIRVGNKRSQPNPHPELIRTQANKISSRSLGQEPLVLNVRDVDVKFSDLPDISSFLMEPFQWCYIPLGSVEILSNWDDENEYIKYQVGGFHISKYPVTYEQFRAFVFASDGYSNEQWWEDRKNYLAYNEIISEFNESKQGQEKLIPALVKRFDVISFCRWLSYKFMQTITIPTEAHWQRSAQGDDARKYPWGNIFDPMKCNSGLSGIKRLTPVNRYPNGASSYGVQDLSGNTCEWCNLRSIGNEDFGDASYYQSILGYNSASFHARNSSYEDNNPNHFSCAYRGQSYAPSPDKLAGFRLCLPSSISIIN